MKMTEHTPGPWLVSPGNMLVYRDRSRPVAALINTGSGPEQEANARLIAAAPDLLAALTLAKKELKFWHDLNSSAEMKEQDWQAYNQTGLMQTINKAITKATQP